MDDLTLVPEGVTVGVHTMPGAGIHKDISISIREELEARVKQLEDRVRQAEEAAQRAKWDQDTATASLLEALENVGKAEAQRDALAASHARLLAENESVGDALDEVSPGWQGDYPDAIRVLGQQRDALAAALQEAKRLARLPDSIASQETATTAFRALADPSAILAARDREKDEKIAALAAALEAVKPLLPHRRDYEPHPQHSTPCRACEILAILRSLETMDLSAILAARDERIRQEGCSERDALAAANVMARAALVLMYDEYENGTPTYEDSDELGGFLGNAFQLSESEEKSVLEALEALGVETALRGSGKDCTAEAILAARDERVRREAKVGLLRHLAANHDDNVWGSGGNFVRTSTLIGLADRIEREGKA